MKTVLFTGYDASYTPLANLTLPLMQDYADRHDIDFKSFPLPPPGLNIYWTGVARGLQLLENYDRIIYLDVDQMVTNMDFDIEGWLNPGYGYGFHAPQDWGKDATGPEHRSACCLIMHPDCIPILEKILAIEPEYQDKPFQEQAPMRDVLTQWSRHGDVSCTVYQHKRKPMNCVPDQVCPGEVPEPWTHGDWCCHITMVPLERRIEIFHEIKKLIG